MAQSNIILNALAPVFGASGLAGWAAVDQFLENYPANGTF
jgi:hypothetical protein